MYWAKTANPNHKQTPLGTCLSTVHWKPQEHLTSWHGGACVCARLLFCIQYLCEGVGGIARQIVIQCWSNPIIQKVLSKPPWPLCSDAAVFTLAPLALNTSHIFLTLGSSRLTLGHVNSERPVSRDQSTHCLFGPAPYVCECVGVHVYDCVYWSQKISLESLKRCLSPSPKTSCKVPVHIYHNRIYVWSWMLCCIQ